MKAILSLLLFTFLSFLSPIGCSEAAIKIEKTETQSTQTATKKDVIDTSQQKVQGVITLTSKNFDSSINDGSKWLIEFYSPWCSHCKRFTSTYESIAQHLHSTTDNIKVGKVDGSVERALSSRFSIKGYPTFFLIDGWDVYEFKKSRSKDNMIQFALQKQKNMETVNFLMGPFGPFGMVRMFVMNTGTRILNIFEYLVKERGINRTIAAVSMAGIGVFVGTLIVIFVGLMLIPKPKVD